MAIKPHTRAQLVKELDETTIALNKVQDELKKTPDGEIDKIDLNEAIIEYRVAKTALAKFDAEHDSVVADKKNEHKTSHNIEISNDKVETGYQYIDTAIRHALDNPELSLYKIT